jgi:hypothetical protein
MGLLNFFARHPEPVDPSISAEVKGIHHSVVQGRTYLYILPVMPDLVFTGKDDKKVRVLQAVQYPNHTVLVMNRMSHVMATDLH